MSIIVLLYSETIYNCEMCSDLRSRVQNTNAFSCALLWRVVYSSQFYCSTSRYFGVLSIFTGKVDAKDSRYSHLLDTLISSEYGLTISGHVTVLRHLLLEKNTFLSSTRIVIVPNCLYYSLNIH